MCGRYYIDDNDASEIRKILDELDERHSVDVGEIYPTNIAPVICRSGVTAIKWGFPQWNSKGVIINARAETAPEKAMFRKPLLEHRCVVPCSGYFEWQAVAGTKKKDKYLLNRPGDGILYLAGIYDVFRDANGEYEAFVILTTAANESVSHIHDRMPVIVTGDELEAWLEDTRFTEHILKHAGPELMSAEYIA